MSLYIHKLDNVTSINLEIRLVLHSTRFTRYQLHDITNPFSIARDAKCHTHTTLRNSTPTIPSSPRNPILARKTVARSAQHPARMEETGRRTGGGRILLGTLEGYLSIVWQRSSIQSDIRINGSDRRHNGPVTMRGNIQDMQIPR